VLDYDAEAPGYDASRGGEERAEAAAAAVRSVLPGDARVVLDVACGTGIVSARLRAAGRVVVGVDASAGMLRVAAPRLEGRVVRGDAARLPVADSSVDAVVFMWFLHLAGRRLSAEAIGEAARVLRPGGALITTVDKNFAMYAVPSDLASVVEPVHRRVAPTPTDGSARVVAIGQRYGLVPNEDAGYVGRGQGWSPRTFRGELRTLGWYRSCGAADIAELEDRVAGLPDQDVPRPDPVYRLVVLAKPAVTEM
jgi:SAM-dependent methyltransferase